MRLRRGCTTILWKGCSSTLVDVALTVDARVSDGSSFSFDPATTNGFSVMASDA